MNARFNTLIPISVLANEKYKIVGMLKGWLLLAKRPTSWIPEYLLRNRTIFDKIVSLPWFPIARFQRIYLRLRWLSKHWIMGLLNPVSCDKVMNLGRQSWRVISRDIWEQRISDKVTASLTVTQPDNLWVPVRASQSDISVKIKYLARESCSSKKSKPNCRFHDDDYQ